ncbi:MAG: hypothetical protein EBY41_02935 [Proteobacteria bacterium]|nr:hypothetical protein [Pseudomonadota bacterium]
MAKQENPGDVKIIQAKLKSKANGAEIDIRAQMIEVSIFEDVDQPSLYCIVQLLDSLNLVEDFPIIGEETFTFTWLSAGRKEFSSCTFDVFSVDSLVAGPSGKEQQYTLHCVSPEHLISASMSVVGTFRNTTDVIVRSVLERYIGTKKILVAEESKGLAEVTLPNYTPFQTIDYLRQRSVSKLKDQPSSFFFFESQKGYHYASLDYLIQQGIPDIKSKVFTFNENINSDKEREARSFRNLKQYLQLDTFDSIKKAAGGAMKGQTSALDIISKDVEISGFNIDKQMKSIIGSDPKAAMSNSLEFMSAFVNNPKFKGKTNTVTKDKSKGNSFNEGAASIKDALFQVLNNGPVRCLADGDNYLKAGDMIELNLPENSGTSNSKGQNTLRSGNFFITKLRHQILKDEKDFKYQCSWDCSRMGVQVK